MNFMKVKKIREIIDNGDGNITIVHSDGTFHYNEHDVTLKEWTNNFFCRFNIDEQSNWQRFIFWNWVLSFTFGLFFILVGMKFMVIPLESKQHGVLDLVRVFLEYLLYLIPISIFCYSIFRILYFFVFRDFFSKDLIHISLKSNQSILLVGTDTRTFNYYTQFLKFISGNKFTGEKVFYKNESNRIFDTNKDNDEAKLFSNYIVAVVIFSLCFYSIYSNWGENSITDPNPSNSIYFEGELSKKELSRLTKKQEYEYKHKRLIDKNEYNEIKAKWDKKYENENISSFYFFSQGYVLPLLTGSLVVGGFLLFGLSVLFLMYLALLPLGYSISKFYNRRELIKVLKKKFVYPIVIILFSTGLVINYILTENVIATLVFILVSIFAPLLFFVIFVVISILSDKNYPSVSNLKELGNLVFSRKYWKFLFTGNPDFSSEYSFLHIVVMITLPWLLLFYHGFDNYIFNDGTPRSTLQEIIFVAIIFAAMLRFIRRIISPWGLNYFFSINFSTIKNGRYLRFFKNDVLSINSLVLKNGMTLEYASKRLKDNDMIVENAVQNNGLSLQFASAELRNDKNIVLKAIKQNPKAIELASIEMQNDPDIIEQLKKGDS